ncbi:MAG TPA: PfkB family carbohydrate kinase [Acidimicrobiales bacterium]
MTRVVVVGDAILDRDVAGSVTRVAPDAPAPVVDFDTTVARPGGAALAAVLAARHGVEVVLVAGIGSDGDGRELRELVESAGVHVVALALEGPTPTKTRVRCGDHTLVRLDRPTVPGAIGCPDSAARAALAQCDGVLVSDYGRGATAHPGVRELLAGDPVHAPVVWDPHPRGAPPTRGVRLLTPNEDEARRMAGAERLDAIEAGVALLARFGVGGVAVTTGASGAVLVLPHGPPLVVPARAVAGDTCGAGDAFAAAAVVALAREAALDTAVDRAVRAATAFVAAGGASRWATADGRHAVDSGGDDRRDPSRAGVLARADEVRRRGGRIVATSGCFDLLHAGHVGMLDAARALGDHLVVLLNSDASARRLKGEGRPLQRAADRAAVLRGLKAVDDVLEFDEDTPVDALRVLRPHVFVKGGDYAYRDIPESAVMRSLGGRVVVVPYVTGRSTSALIRVARERSG